MATVTSLLNDTIVKQQLVMAEDTEVGAVDTEAGFMGKEAGSVDTEAVAAGMEQNLVLNVLVSA